MGEKKCRIRIGFLERPLSQLCYRYSLIVSRHPYWFIVLPILLTSVLAYGNLHKNVLNNMNQLYIPQTGPSLDERAAIIKNFPQLDGKFTPSRSINDDGLVSVLVRAQDDGDVLRPELRQAVVRLNELLAYQVRVKVDGETYTYHNVCMRHRTFCHTNPQLYALDAIYTSPGAYDRPTYPTAQMGSRRFYIGASLGGVQVDPELQYMTSAKAWQLTYQMRWDDSVQRVSELLQREMERVLIEYDDDLVDIAFFHSETMNIEIVRNADGLLVRFLICLSILWVFSQLCSITILEQDGFFSVDWTRSKFIVASCGLFGALMGIASAIGFLSYVGYPYNSVCDAMPFLVLGVRLDNTFLMISAVHYTKRSLSAEQRLAEAMSEAAVSITITVMTDVLSFAVGLITDFLAVQMFSLYTVVAVSITFAYQLTFFMAALALSVRAEHANRHSLLPLITTVDPSHENLKLFDRLLLVGSQSPPRDAKLRSGTTARNRRSSATAAPPDELNEGTWMSRWIVRYYAPFISRPLTQFGVFVVYVIYLAVAIFGALNVRQGLEPIRLLLPDSYAVDYYHQLQKYFWNIGTQAQIVFLNAGDIASLENRLQINAIMREFAHSRHGMGDEGVDFWLDAFSLFLQDHNGQQLNNVTDRNEFYQNLLYFLSFEENAVYKSDVFWAPTNASDPNITAFRGVIGLKNFSRALDQMDTVDDMRYIAAKYPQYQIVTFQPMWMFVDQYQQVLPNTAQEVYSGVAFMVLIALLLIPSYSCSFWVAVAILSIDVGVLGFMTFWGINLDVISMITIVMSIGFSVDFTAHIAHAFVVTHTEDDSPVAKTAAALGGLAWPITQGAISTIMGVVVLSGTDSYVSTAFFRTVLLVIVLGLVHAVVFLPVVLSVCSSGLLFCRSGSSRCGTGLEKVKTLTGLAANGAARPNPKPAALTIEMIPTPG